MTADDAGAEHGERRHRHGTAVQGGSEIPAESGGGLILIANAAVIVRLDDGT